MEGRRWKQLRGRPADRSGEAQREGHRRGAGGSVRRTAHDRSGSGRRGHGTPSGVKGTKVRPKESGSPIPEGGEEEIPTPPPSSSSRRGGEGGFP